ncbi:unnamed protein product [Leuciscus chuanchicus]
MCRTTRENAVKDPRIDQAVGLCKTLVSTFSYSKREFLAGQKELKLPEHSLKTECTTRWGSRQATIERVIEQQKAIAHVLSSDKKLWHLIPTWQDMDVLEVINKSLKPLVELTDALRLLRKAPEENTEEDAEAGCASKRNMTLGSYFKTSLAT